MRLRRLIASRARLFLRLPTSDEHERRRRELLRRTARTLRFAQRFECKECNLRYEEPEPRLFSFNNPYGACPRCQGFGNTIDFDLDLVIPDKLKTISDGAIEPWTKPKYRPLFTELKRFAKRREFRWTCRGRIWRTSSGTDPHRRRQVPGSARILSITWSARNTSCTCGCF